MVYGFQDYHFISGINFAELKVCGRYLARYIFINLSISSITWLETLKLYSLLNGLEIIYCSVYLASYPRVNGWCSLSPGIFLSQSWHISPPSAIYTLYASLFPHRIHVNIPGASPCTGHKTQFKYPPYKPWMDCSRLQCPECYV